MNHAGTTAAAKELSESQRQALVCLLADEDPSVYQTVRAKILSCGPSAAEWLRPLATSNDAALRRRAQQIVLHFDRQAADDHGSSRYEELFSSSPVSRVDTVHTPPDLLLRLKSNRVFATLTYPNALAGFLVVVFAPMPNARVNTATAVKPGLLRSWRTA